MLGARLRHGSRVQQYQAWHDRLGFFIRMDPNIRRDLALLRQLYRSRRMRQMRSNILAKKRGFVAAVFRECSVKFNLMVWIDCEPRTASLAFGVLVKFITELSQIGVDAVPQRHPFGVSWSWLPLLSSPNDPIQIPDPPCQLRSSARSPSSASSYKPKRSLLAGPWSSQTQRRGRWKASGLMRYTACEFRSEATMGSGLSPPSNSCRRTETTLAPTKIGVWRGYADHIERDVVDARRLISSLHRRTVDCWRLQLII